MAPGKESLRQAPTGSIPHMGAISITPAKGNRPDAAHAMLTAPPMDSPRRKKGRSAPVTGSTLSSTAAGCTARAASMAARGVTSPVRASRSAWGQGQGMAAALWEYAHSGPGKKQRASAWGLTCAIGETHLHSCAPLPHGLAPEQGVRLQQVQTTEALHPPPRYLPSHPSCSTARAHNPPPTSASCRRVLRAARASV